MAWCVMRSLLCSCMAEWWLHTTHNKQRTTHSGGCCYGLWSRPHDYTHHIGNVAGSAMRTALCNCQYSLLMVELADSNSRNHERVVRVGNTPWFRRVRWALCCCCLTPAPGEEAGGSGLNVGAVLLHAWRWAEPPALPSAETKKHTQTRSETAVISRYRPFVLLRCVSRQQQQPTATGCLLG